MAQMDRRDRIMGWEIRNGRRYYYQSQRDGDKVRKIYVGSGDVGRAAELALECRREQQQRVRDWLRLATTKFAELDAIDAEVAVGRAAILYAQYGILLGVCPRIAWCPSIVRWFRCLPGVVGDLGAHRGRKDQLDRKVNLQILSRLWVAQISCHSARIRSRPRCENLRKPRTRWIWPNTGSTMCLRAAYSFRPNSVCNFCFIASFGVTTGGA